MFYYFWTVDKFQVSSPHATFDDDAAADDAADDES